MDKFKEIKKSLELLGLSDNAISFYVASYKTGFASVGKIAQKLNMDRSSAYLALSQLAKMGLVEEKSGKKIKIVCVKKPQAILNCLKTQKRKLINQHLKIEECLPELLAEFSEKNYQPVLQFFSGKVGLQQITDDILDCCDSELLVFSNQKEEKRVFSNIDHKEFVKERVKKGVRVRVLTPNTIEARELKKEDKGCLRETRIISDKEIPFVNEVYIYADKIAMLEFVEEVQGFIVKSKAFNQAQKWMFEEIWELHNVKKND